MAITVDVDESGLNAKLARLREVIRAPSLIAMMKPEGRLLGKALVKYTQPFGTDKAAQQRGRHAVDRDFARVYQSPDTDKGLNFLAGELSSYARPKDRLHARERFRRYLASGDTTAFERVCRDMHIKTKYGKRADPSVHALRWRGNNGKLRKGPFQIVTVRGSAAKLAREARNKVGFAKSGWCGAMRDLGGDKDIPAWIKKNNAPGRAEIVSAGEYACKITLINEVNYTGRVLSQSNKRAALREREAAIGSRIDRILKARIQAADRAASTS